MKFEIHFQYFFNFSQKTPSKNNEPNTMITKDQSESCYSSHQNCLKDKRQYQNSLMTKSKALWQPLYTLETLKSKFYLASISLLMEFISKCGNEGKLLCFENRSFVRRKEMLNGSLKSAHIWFSKSQMNFQYQIIWNVPKSIFFYKLSITIRTNLQVLIFFTVCILFFY